MDNNNTVNTPNVNLEELPIEKIKDAISLASLLPELIDKYEKILNKVDVLTEQVNAFSALTNGQNMTIKTLKDEISKLDEDCKENNKLLVTATRRIDSIASRLANGSVKTEQPKTETLEPKANSPKPKAKPAEEKDEVIEKLKLLMKGFSGRKSMMVTKSIICKSLKVDNTMADKIIERAKALHIYDEATKTLKYKDIKD